MQRILVLLSLSVMINSAICASVVSTDPVPLSANTTIESSEAPNGTIEYKILQKPHHLFIGRCKPEDKILHQENVVLINDGKSHVAAGIRTHVEADVYITCVKIFDEIPDGEGGYPSFVAGGVGHNYVEFKVLTNYGKGFHFFVQIYGHVKKEIPIV